MLGTALIVFREVLEASLIVGIVGAATRGIAGRGRWIATGLTLGVVGSILVAFGAEAIASVAEGMGQELFNASILGIAVGMLAWHNIWMSVHGRELSQNAQKVGSDIRSGAKELSVLALVVLIAVLREGSETVLFLYGIAASGGNTASTMITGGVVGLAGGVAVGWLLFAGLLRIPIRHFFTATSVLVLLLAAGMASQAARFLIQANVLPSLASPLWDTSSIVSNGSLAGKALTGIVGYDAQPAGMQVAFFVVVAVAIIAGMTWAKRRHPSPSSSSS